jgi:putative transposase
MNQVPKSAAPWVATMLRTVFEQGDAASVRAQMAQVIGALDEKFPKAAEHLEHAGEGLLAFAAYPREVWRQVWSNNPMERLNETSHVAKKSSGQCEGGRWWGEGRVLVEALSGV